MSAPPTQLPRPRPSTPASSSAHPSQHVTPRSNVASSHASPAKSHSRAPSGSHLMPGRTVGSHPMQRTISSGLESSLGTSGSAIPTRSVNGTSSRGVAAGKKPAGKTVLGMSSAGKSLGVDNLGSRPVTPSRTGPSSLANGSPAVLKGSPAPSSLGGGMAHLDALAGLGSPAMNGLPAIPGSAPMGLSLSNISGLGLGAAMNGSMQGAKLDEETRRKRLETVLQTLRKRSGCMSREGIQRLARKCGMETYWDGDDNVTLAGQNSVMIDLHYKPEQSLYVERTKLQLHAVSDDLEVHSEKASKILQNDLTPGDGLSAIEAKLDKFANNLERLVAMDKLSTPGANCFEAVFGVYKSLKRLYDHECTALQSLRSQEEHSSKVSPGIEIMCTKSGRPKMHARDRVGLSLEYWSNHSEAPRSVPSRPNDAMDLDDAIESHGTTEDSSIHSITIECEHASPALYPPIRISDGWIADRMIIPPEESATIGPDPDAVTRPSLIDWQSPAPTYQTPAVESDKTTATPLLPHARFVAHFEPSVALPIQLAANIYANVGLNLQSIGSVASPYDELLLNDLLGGNRAASKASPPSEYPYTHTTSRSIFLPTTSSNSDEQTTRYTTRVFTTRAEHALTLQQIPFEHPRQIIAILPVVRQFARFHNIVRQSYQSDIPPSAPPSKSYTTPATSKPARRIVQKRPFDTAFPFNTTSAANADSADDEVDAFLKAPPETKVPQTIEMTYSVLLSPRIEITFPAAAGLKSVSFGVGLNGIITVEAQNVFDVEDAADHVDGERQDGEDGEGNADGDHENEDRSKAEGTCRAGKIRAKVKKMAKALEVCEDLSLWVLWCRRVMLTEEVEVEVERNDGDAGGFKAAK